MSNESTITRQLGTYHHLHSEHELLRREEQGILIEPLRNLNEDVQNSLTIDESNYKQAEQAYHQQFNAFKRLFKSAASEYEVQSVLPLKQIYHQRKDLAAQILELLNETNLQTAPIETREYWNGAIAVAYNPNIGQAEWKQHWHGGIHGVFNPLTGTVEWRNAFHSGIYGVFNPRSNVIEWKTQFNGGVHGVYNPSLGVVEWKSAFHSGVGGVYNHLKEEVEWKTCFNGGVIGNYDYKTQTIQWTEKWHHGLALISWDEKMRTYSTTASCGWFDNE